MHVDSHLEMIDEEDNEKDGTHPPNRKLFESELENIHARINLLREDIKEKSIWCSQLNQNREEMHEAKQKNYQEYRENKLTYEDIKKQIESKKKQHIELEDDCRIRNKSKLLEILTDYEKRYQNARTGRNETILVTEIDALKRNLAKLEKLEVLKNEQASLETQLQNQRAKKEACWRTLNHMNKKRNDRKEKEKQIEQEKQELSNLCYSRKKLIDEYNNDRADYKQWLSRSNHSNVPSTFPTVRKSKPIIIDEELEPFYEIKRDCTRLLNYLENLKTSAQIEDIRPSIESEKIDTDDDSADELPPQLIRNKPEKACPIRRNLKRSTQPISHNIDIYKLFGAIDVDVPQHYADVPNAIEAVKEKLDFYKNQTTNEFEWADELKFDLLSISRTTSELDSACFEDSLSDFGSISSSRRVSSRQSVQSPIS